MNEELVRILERLKGYEEVNITKFVTSTLLVKFVYSEIAEVQRLKEVYTLAYVRKGKRFFGVSLTGDADVAEILEEGFKYAVESNLYPILTDNDREVKVVEDNSYLESIIREGDVSQIEKEIDNSEYPVSGTVSIYSTEIGAVTSKGFNGYDKRYKVTGYVRAFNKEYSGQWGFFSSSLNDLKESIRKANEYASISGKINVDDGAYDVVLSPLVMANFMTYFADFASAFSVLTGSSFLAKYKPGDKVASEKVTISDVPRSGRIAEFDAETTFTFDKEIIKDGVFKTLLYNNELALMMGGKSTGNAGIIYPIAFAFDIQGGDESLDSLLSSNRVIFFNNVWYTRFQNYYEGSFSTVGRDAVIVYDNGKPLGVAGRIRIADTFPRLLQNIEGLSRERYWVKWWDAPIPTNSPYVLVKSLKISKA
jgi:PmbA protein